MFSCFESGLDLNFDFITFGPLRVHAKDRNAPRQACFSHHMRAAEIMANAPLALGASKRVIVKSRGWPLAEMFAQHETITGNLLKNEGASAFAEKRSHA